jgi:hypothetical protein
MIDDTTLERGLRARPPADPVYRSRITATPPTALHPVVIHRATAQHPRRFLAMNATLKVSGVAVLALAVGIGVVQLRPSTTNVASNLSPSAVPSASLSADAPSHEPVASPVTETIHGWPGVWAAPAGLYSWNVAPTPGFSRTNYMHKGSVELTFYARTSSSAVQDIKADGVNQGWRADGSFDRPSPVGSTEMWIIDVEGTRVAIVLNAYPQTDPALVEEARAVIESIVVEPTETGRRLVFRLQEGWDSG